MPVKKSRNRTIRQLDPGDDFAEILGTQSSPADVPVSPKPDEGPFERMLENALSELDNGDILNQKSPEHENAEPRTHTRRRCLSMHVQAELDLHGCHVHAAFVRVEAFIETAALQGLHTVRIIVGKGLHSPGGAVLPDAVEKKIVELKRRGRVATFAWEKKYKRASGSIIAVLP